MRAFLLSLIVAAAATAFVVAPGSAGALSTCVNLKVTTQLKPDLRKAYFTLHKDHSSPAAGTTYYGRCGSTQWAAGDFPDPRAHGETNDQPETFRKLSGHPWHDIGDDGSLCTVPRRLAITLWHLRGPC